MHTVGAVSTNGPHGGWGRAAARTLAKVGASVPAKEMLEGEVGVNKGRGGVVASLASWSTSLLRWLPPPYCASQVSDS